MRIIPSHPKTDRGSAIRSRLIIPRSAGLAFLLISLAAFLGSASFAASDRKPNIVYILADDLGYGDVRALNPNGKIPTPNLDRLAAGGMVFTDAHSSSAVCTPTRYGLLTGRYNWRSRLKSGVLGGMSPPLIEPGRLTVPAFLQQNGYHTACIGKWHLGMEWARKPDTAPFTDDIEKGADGWRVDFSRAISRGPNSFGFDYFFGIAASLDMVPYTFIENDRVTKIPTEDNAFPMMIGRTNGMTRRGPAAAGFEAIDVLSALTHKAVDYIEERVHKHAGEPFFLYLPLNAPHTPIAPTKEWQGKSGLNPYADFVMQVDSEVGKVLAALNRLGAAANTLVIFASDNGCSPEAKFEELRAKGHDPSAQFRGTKADIFDGGHRIPFIARWPGHIKAGSTSDQIICLNDLFATCAEILEQKLPENAAEDSVSILPALESRASRPLHEALVHHSINGSFAVRQSNWKLELCPDSGGWSVPRPGSPASKQLPEVQLYDLSVDAGETNNVLAAHPEVVARLTQILEKYVNDGRSTPGPKQANTTPVAIRRGSERAAVPAEPNILFIIADQWRAQAFGFAGDPNVKTPHLDQFERQCINFTQAVSGTPVCSPTRASLLTGQRPQTHGVFLNDVPLSTNAITLPKILKSVGYDTGCIGKWHIDGHGSRSAFIPPERRHGFDYWKVL
ncbi:MAG: arylsulfatase family protein [Verrucomicrobiales bacterium]|nr:arylsulfatase family protein [Verrucomicrobiales bacterium]